MIGMKCRRLLVIILFQSAALFGAQKPEVKRTKYAFRAAMIARQKLKVAHENNKLLTQNNALLTQLLQSTMQANALAAEHVKAIQEQNKIHLELVRMQQSSFHDHSGDFKSEPHSPSSSCPTPPSSLGRSISGNRLAAAAHEVGLAAMLAPTARSARRSLSASSPDLQGLILATRKKGRSGPSLPTVFSPAHVEPAAGAGGALKIQVTPVKDE